MKKVLIAYSSRTGTTQKMADYLAEGFRMSGNEVENVKISAIKDESALSGYDAYLFGCPTYHKDMTGSMKQFLFKAEKAELAGKIAGAFGSHTHSGEAAPMIYETMQYVLKMDAINLGALSLTDDVMATNDGLKACHDYARAIAEKL